MAEAELAALAKQQAVLLAARAPDTPAEGATMATTPLTKRLVKDYFDSCGEPGPGSTPSTVAAGVSGVEQTLALKRVASLTAHGGTAYITKLHFKIKINYTTYLGTQLRPKLSLEGRAGSSP